MTAVLKLERLAVGVLGMLAILIAAYSTAARYLFPALAPDWGEEVVVYLSVWALWLSVGSLARTNGHIRAEILTHRLPAALQRAFEALHCLAGIAFCGFMGIAGLDVVRQSIAVGEHGDSTLMLPLWLYYACMPVGMALMFCAYVARLAAIARFTPERH